MPVAAAPESWFFMIAKTVMFVACLVSLLSLCRAATLAADRAASPSQPTSAASRAAAQSGGETSPFAIRGTVVDEHGAPVPNATVTTAEGLGRRAELTTRTDAAGKFTLNLPSRSVVPLLARDQKGGRLGFVERSSGRPGPRIVLRAARAIPVSVVDGKERPVAGAKVSVDFYFFAPRRAPQQMIQQSTDAGGKALLRVPSDMPLASVFAVKAGAGFDYVIYRNPNTRSLGNGQPRPIDPDQRAPDDSRPIKFVLSGVHKWRIHLVDERRRALAGVRVQATFLQRPNRGGRAHPFGIEEFEVVSDRAGIAEFNVIPVEATPPLILSTATKGYFLYQQAAFNPADAVTDLTVVATRLPVLRVQVTYADGRPALGARVHYTWRIYRRRGRARVLSGQLLYDSAGEMDALAFQGDAYCVVTARTRGFVSAMAARVARMGEPLRPVHLVLQPAAHVHGTLTWGKDRHPDANEPVTLIERDDNYSKLPEDERLPRTLPLAQLAHVAIDVPRHATTDAQGRFEYEVAPGRYVIGRGRAHVSDEFGKAADVKDLFDDVASEFEIKDQKDVEINLHREDPSSAEPRAAPASQRSPHIRLQVTYPDGRPAPEAKTQYAARHDGRGSGLTVGNSLVGRSSIRLDGDAYYVISATSGPFASALVARVARMANPVRPVHLVLNPAARVHGTLTAGKDRHPAANARFVVIQQDEDHYSKLPEGERLPHLRQIAVDIPVFESTDAEGHFEFYAAPGRHVIVPQNVRLNRAADPDEVKTLIKEGAREFQIKDQKDLEINAHLE